MKRAAPLRRTEMKPRTKPMERTPLRSGGTLTRAVAATRKPARDTGFTAKQKLAIRTRAGNGDPDQACCEATGVFLGRHGGEIQHIQARGMGGSKRRNNVGNGVLLSSAAHRLAESRDPHMHAMGFWRYSHEAPGPIMLHGALGGVLVGLDDEGNYVDATGTILRGVA